MQPAFARETKNKAHRTIHLANTVTAHCLRRAIETPQKGITAMIAMIGTAGYPHVLMGLCTSGSIRRNLMTLITCPSENQVLSITIDMVFFND